MGTALAGFDSHPYRGRAIPSRFPKTAPPGLCSLGIGDRQMPDAAGMEQPDGRVQLGTTGDPRRGRRCGARGTVQGTSGAGWTRSNIHGNRGGLSDWCGERQGQRIECCARRSNCHDFTLGCSPGILAGGSRSAHVPCRDRMASMPPSVEGFEAADASIGPIAYDTDRMPYRVAARSGNRRHERTCCSLCFLSTAARNRHSREPASRSQDRESRTDSGS